MRLSAIERSRLAHVDRRCYRLARELSALYHRAVQARMPLETLTAVAHLANNVAAIESRVFALRYPMEAKS